jgi:serpin B
MRSLLSIVGVILLLVACGSDGQDAASPKVRLLKADTPRIESPDVSNAQVAKLVRGKNDFAFDLYHSEGGEDDLIFSPYSISLAFSMAYAGARNETEAQMAQTLHFLPQNTQHPAFDAIDQQMSALGEEGGESAAVPFRLNVANAAWGQRGYRFEEAYLKTLAVAYGAGLRTIDFGRPEAASEEINAWISSQTEDRIKNLVSPEVIAPDTLLVLTNAVYFKASWLSTFEESRTQDGPFTPLDGGETTVPMMHQTTYLDYAEGDGYQAVRLPYKGEAADMLVILPDEGRFGAVEERLDAGFLDDVDHSLDTKYVRLTMPRFDFEMDLDLIKSLRRLGMAAPFNPSAADFSGITGGKDLYIGEALHRANITVDEKGTEAAAATVLAMPDSMPPPPTEMTMDRPFIFAIVERDTGTILFLGRVTEPQE